LSDFDEFDYIFAMDKSNLADVQREQKKKPNSKAKVMLFGEFSGKKKAEEVQDPYYGGKGGFELAYEKVARFSMHVLETFIESPSPRE
jgi:low molecular weight phosphotyrosine protein phosphatase